MILSAAEKKNRAIRKRRKIAIIASAILIAVLAVALVFILDYVRTSTFVDRSDGTEYYIRYRQKAYGLYDTDKKTKLPVEEQYGYYVTHSGTLVGIDAATGEVTRTIYVDTSHLEGAEQLGINDSIMIFRHVEAKDIRSIQVFNRNGTHSYEFARINAETLKRDDTGEFAIVGSPLSLFDVEIFSALRVATGYTITTGKIQDPIKDEAGQFSEYGLVPERRVDDEGNEYDYVPTYYILTEISGARHKVIIGDRLVTGSGYYAQYVKMDGTEEIPFDAVYILGTYVADSILRPLEDYVTPELTYPMSLNSFHDVEYFKLHKKKGDAGEYSELVAFSYVDMSERENTSRHHEAYRFDEGSSPAYSLKGYKPNANHISDCLAAIYEPNYVGIHTFMVTDEALVETGLYKIATNPDGTPKLDDDGKPVYVIDADYMLTFYYSPRDEEENKLTPVQNIVMISGPNEDGNYYAFTQIYTKNSKGDYEYAYNLDMIVELDGFSMTFLTWESTDWVSENYISMDIVFCGSIKLETKDYSASFTLDNSLSDQTNGKNSDLLSVTGSDSKGHTATTFAQKVLRDKYGYTWIISAEAIQVYTATGIKQEYTSIHYEKNSLDRQVQVDTVGIECENGDVVYVEADAIVTRKPDGTVEREVRYHTTLFRSLYRTFTFASIKDTYPLDDWSAEDKAALLSDENCFMTLTFVAADGEEYVYRFYKLTSRKAFMTLNGNGEFCVSPQRLEKFVTDCERFFNLEIIDDTGKT